ncbi:MAG TPA: peptidylprolyl isomerase [Lactobacillaceae bacterium]|jgi:foldase protein PrsA
MRKIFWSALVLIFLAGLLFLTFNSSKTLATSKAGKITEAQFYSSMKTSTSGQQLFANMVINKVLAHEYGDKVQAKDVDAAVTEQKAQYGDSFNTMLAQSNMTEKQFEDSIKNNLLTEAAIKDNYKVTQKQLDAAYKDYHASTELQIIQTTTKADAQKAIDAINGGMSFDDAVTKYSKDDSKSAKGKLSAFTSTDTTTVDSNVKTAGWKLDAGKYTTAPVEGADGNFYVVKLLSEAKKGSESSVKSALTDQIVNDFMNDSSNSTAIQGIIGKILRANDVSIKDSDLKNVLNTYMTAGVDSSSSSSSK